MSSPRLSIARLIAMTLVIAGAPGVGSRAPQALRVWTDTVAEVARAGVATTRVQARSGRATRRAPDAPPALPGTVSHIVTLDDAPVRQAIGTLAWPTAHAGRDILALKRSRLI